MSYSRFDQQPDIAEDAVTPATAVAVAAQAVAQTYLQRSHQQACLRWS